MPKNTLIHVLAKILEDNETEGSVKIKLPNGMSVTAQIEIVELVDASGEIVLQTERIPLDALDEE